MQYTAQDEFKSANSNKLNTLIKTGLNKSYKYAVS